MSARANQRFALGELRSPATLARERRLCYAIHAMDEPIRTPNPTIWIDADACPRDVKEIVFRASTRLEIPVRLVANQGMRTPPSDLISAVPVPEGMDVADDHIVDQVATEDIVVTADVPLAARVVEKGAVAINPRGQQYDETNAQQRLAVRDLMEELRNQEMVSGGPRPYGPVDKQSFANTLDRILTRKLREGRRAT